MKFFFLDNGDIQLEFINVAHDNTHEHAHIQILYTNTQYTQIAELPH